MVWIALVALLMAVGCALPGVARASEIEARIAVVQPAGGDPMADRLEEELRGVGLTPVSLVRPPALEVAEQLPATQPLDALRVQAEAVAAFEVDSGAGRVWLVVDDPRGEPVSRTLDWDPADPAAESLVGIEAVELLRAALLEVATVRQRKALELSLFELALGEGPAGNRAGLHFGTEIVGGSFEGNPHGRVLWGFRIPVLGRLRATFDLAIPYVRTVFRGDEGTVWLSASEVDLGASWLLVEPDSDWLPEVGGAIGIAVRRLGVEPAPLWEVIGAPGSTTVRPALSARSVLTSPRLGTVAARGMVQLDLFRPQQVQIRGEPIGRWGPAALGFGLGVDVVL